MTHLLPALILLAAYSLQEQEQGGRKQEQEGGRRQEKEIRSQELERERMWVFQEVVQLPPEEVIVYINPGVGEEEGALVVDREGVRQVERDEEGAEKGEREEAWALEEEGARAGEREGAREGEREGAEKAKKEEEGALAGDGEGSGESVVTLGLPVKGRKGVALTRGGVAGAFLEGRGGRTGKGVDLALVTGAVAGLFLALASLTCLLCLRPTKQVSTTDRGSNDRKILFCFVQVCSCAGNSREVRLKVVQWQGELQQFQQLKQLQQLKEENQELHLQEEDQELQLNGEDKELQLQGEP